MNPDNQLLVGIVMMSLGGFVALFAYTILREQQKAAKKKAGEEAEEPKKSKGGPAQEKQHDADEPGDTQKKDIKEILAASFQKAKEWALERDKSEEITEPQEEETKEPEVVKKVVEESPTTSKSINIFTLLRDEEKGNLIVQVGNHEYYAAQDLHDSPDWSRVEHAAGDLSVWLSSAEDQESKTKVTDLPERKPHSMVEQINHFLQRKLAEIEDEKRRIKLYEGPDESVHVLIGNNSYSIDEVPDSKVSKLIREAVAEWEALQ